MDSGFAISPFTANNIRVLIISCPTALSTFNVEIISITSCSQTSISERTFKHLQSKSGKTLFSSFKGVGMIRVDFGSISETVYIDIILNTIIER